MNMYGSNQKLNLNWQLEAKQNHEFETACVYMSRYAKASHKLMSFDWSWYYNPIYGNCWNYWKWQVQENDKKQISSRTAVNFYEESSDEGDITNFGNEFKNVRVKPRTLSDPKLNEGNNMKFWLYKLDLNL